MKRMTCVWIVIALLTVLAAGAQPVPRTDHDIFIENIALRPGVKVDIHVKVFVNEGMPCHGRGRSLLAVHGFAHTAATWEPFAEALFSDNPTGRPVCRLAAIDLPGRGGSTVPTGLQFSDLLLDDFVTAIEATLAGMNSRGVAPSTLVGHSQGGLLLQMLQQRLIDRGTNLRQRFGVRRAVLLASSPPEGLPWLLVESGAAEALLAQFLAIDPLLGPVVSAPDAAFSSLFFSDLQGVLASGAPTPAEVGERGFNAPEPLLAAANQVGAPPLRRPRIDGGIFSKSERTRLFMVTYEQDTLIRPEENAVLYEFLTEDARLRRLTVITGPETVHDFHVSSPRDLLTAVAGTLRF